MTVRAIYKNGIFKPTEPVNLPDNTPVEVLVPAAVSDDDARLDAIYEVLSERYNSGRHDIAERHNEHQP